MNRLLIITLVIVIGSAGTLQGQNLPNNQHSLAEKLDRQQMTRGLMNKRADGTPGLNYQGGVAGYAGPPRASDIPSIRIEPATTPNQSNAEDQQQEDDQATRPRETVERRNTIVEQQNDQDRQQALQKHQAILRAQREAARVQAERAEAARRQQWNAGDLSGGQINAGDLNMACGSKGLVANYVTGNCISPQGRQVNPYNLYPPFVAPLPTPDAGSTLMRCGAMGRAADFVTGRCM